MSELVDFVEQCIQAAERLESGLSTAVLEMPGLSSPKVRHLLNNLCRRPGTRYLEVGVCKGSTFVSALFGNRDTIVAADAVDNFSQFDATRPAFEANCEVHLAETSFQLHESDFRTVCPSLQPPVSTYFYDGNHSVDDQRDGLLHFWPCLAGVFVLIVDDWNWPDVKNGTFEGIAKSGGRLVQSWELPAAFNGDMQEWWNGVFVAVLQK